MPKTTASAAGGALPAAGQEQPELLEPYGVTDTFATELARVEVVGPCVRLMFAVAQRSVGWPDERVERLVVEKLVIPREAALAMAENVTASLAPQDKPERLTLLEPVGTC